MICQVVKSTRHAGHCLHLLVSYSYSFLRRQVGTRLPEQPATGIPGHEADNRPCSLR